MLVSGYTLHAQKAVIKTSPLGLAFGNFNATYEHILNESSSVLVRASYFYKLLGVDVSSFGIGGGYRYYITHSKVDVPSGFYIQPQIGFAFGGVDDLNYNTFRIGGEIGYQWAWSSGFVLDIGIGPSYLNLSGDSDVIGFDSSSGIFPTATLAVGYVLE